MKTITSFKHYIIAAVLGFGLVLGVSTLQAAGGWTPAPASPPNSNADAPVNVGLNSQSKLGQLFLNTDTSNPYAVGLQVFGKSIFNGTVQINSGTPGTGKILTSDATGNVSWASPATIAGIAPGCSTAGLKIKKNGVMIVNTVTFSGSTFYAYPLAKISNGSFADNGVDGTGDSLPIFCVTTGPDPATYGTNSVPAGSAVNGSLGLCLSHEACPFGVWTYQN